MARRAHPASIRVRTPRAGGRVRLRKAVAQHVAKAKRGTVTRSVGVRKPRNNTRVR